MREEMVMNLVLKTDVAATNKRLREFEEASGIKPKAKDDGTRTTRRPEPETDHRPLIQGLRRVVVPPPKSPYDPFMGMAKKRDYYELRPKYDTRYNDLKKKGHHETAGYDFQEFMDESLLRAYAGLSVFVQDEKTITEGETVPKAAVVGINQDDVF